MKVVYLESGWEEKEEFARKVREKIREVETPPDESTIFWWHFKDIKISSKGKDTLLLFEWSD